MSDKFSQNSLVPLPFWYVSLAFYMFLPGSSLILMTLIVGLLILNPFLLDRMGPFQALVADASIPWFTYGFFPRLIAFLLALVRFFMILPSFRLPLSRTDYTSNTGPSRCLCAQEGREV